MVLSQSPALAGRTLHTAGTLCLFVNVVSRSNGVRCFTFEKRVSQDYPAANAWRLAPKHRGRITPHNPKAIQVAKTDPNLFVHLDAPNGPPEIRFTYVRLKGKTVTAMVIFAAEPPIDGKPSFAVGYAVPKAFQKQGRAKDVLVAAIADMQAGLSWNGVP